MRNFQGFFFLFYELFRLNLLIMKHKSRILIFILFFSGTFLMLINCKKDTNAVGSTVADADGNLYNTVTLGTQTWMVENLHTTKYNDNTAIPTITDNSSWSHLNTPAYCLYNNDAETYKVIYGALYNWYAINTGKLAPKGWHVPSDAEWTTLENYLIASGYNFDASATGNKYAKALASVLGWNSYTGGGTVGNSDYSSWRNITGFTALPGGYRSSDGTFYGIGLYGNWWSSSENGTSSAYNRCLFSNSSSVYRDNVAKICGFSVRCLKD
jgi:uncharacterized protein (TIGR02145 family)